jgi:hypothetical protein
MRCIPDVAALIRATRLLTCLAGLVIGNAIWAKQVA